MVSRPRTNRARTCGRSTPPPVHRAEHSATDGAAPRGAPARAGREAGSLTRADYMEALKRLLGLGDRRPRRLSRRANFLTEGRQRCRARGAASARRWWARSARDSGSARAWRAGDCKCTWRIASASLVWSGPDARRSFADDLRLGVGARARVERGPLTLTPKNGGQLLNRPRDRDRPWIDGRWLRITRRSVQRRRPFFSDGIAADAEERDESSALSFLLRFAVCWRSRSRASVVTETILPPTAVTVPRA